MVSEEKGAIKNQSLIVQSDFDRIVNIDMFELCRLSILSWKRQPKESRIKMGKKFWYLVLFCVCFLSMSVCLAGDGKKEKPHIVPVPELEATDTTLGTHVEIEPIGATDKTMFGNLTTFTLTPAENILACDAERKEIKVIDPTGKTLDIWKLNFSPYAIHCSVSGEVFVAGVGVIAKLDKTGKLIKQVQAQTGGFPDSRSSGITVLGKNVFVGFGTQGSLASRSVIVRFDRDLAEPMVIAQDLRGCCQRLDMVAWKDVLYVGENARHRVVKFDKDGNVLDKWGQRGRDNIEGFGSCCNPMNLYYSPKGELWTAESGLGRIKRYTPDGKFLGLVGYVGVARFTQAGRLSISCSNIAISPTRDESRVYVLDYKENLIRILKSKNSEVK